MSSAFKILCSFFLLTFFVLAILPKPSFAQLKDPSASTWNSYDQGAHSGNALINLGACLGAEIPYGSTSCPVVVLENNNGQLVPRTKQAYGGEGGGGALGASTKFIAQLYNNPPASGVQYLASVINNGFGLTPAYAQVSGTGIAVIQPVQKLWQVFRNVTYLLFIIIFLVVGLMVMFRSKLNPQTVVSIQNALPGLVIGLILVTFSYFISGLIVDLAFLTSQVVGIIFLTQVGDLGGAAATQAVNNLLNNKNFVLMFFDFTFSGNLLSAAGEIGHGLNDIVFQGTTGRITQSIIGGLAACLNPIGLAAIGASFGTGVLACGAIGSAVGGFAGGVIISGIILIVLLIGLLQALIRLIFGLITAYVQIILATIFGPFLILASAIPGKGNLAELWWKTILANVLIFPAVFTLFLLVATILKFGGDWNLSNGLVGDFNQALPLFGGTPVGFIPSLIAYGLLLVAPGIPDLVREIVGAKPNQILQQALRANIGTGAQAAGVAAPAVGRAGYKFIGGGLEGLFRGTAFGKRLAEKGMGPGTRAGQ